MSALQKISSMTDLGSLSGQLLIEAEFQKYFKKTPPHIITNEFKQLSGSVENQIFYLNIALKVIEELDVEPVQAYGLLESLRPVIYEKFKILTYRFIGKTLVANTKANQMVFGAMDLYTRLTDTYDSVIEEAKYFGDSQAFIMGSAIHRAMSDKAKLIQSYFLLYMDIPDRMWKHLNALYLTADEFNIQNQVISDTLLLSEYQLSIKQLYSYALLLSTCDMRNLHVTDIKSVSELLKSLIKSVQLKPRQFPENCIYMDPVFMLKPARYHEDDSQKSEKAFSFDLKGIEKPFAKKYNTQIMVDGERCTLSPEVLNAIYMKWSKPYIRSEDRFAEKRAVVARPGFLLNWNDGEFDTSLLHDDVPLRDYRGLKLNLSPVLESLRFSALKLITKSSNGAYQLNSTDSSEHGFCLVWDSAVAALLQVGELVVIHDSEQATQQLCQILWVKCLTADTIKTGLRILANTIIPVLVKPVKTPGQSSGESIKGFLSPNYLGEKLNYSLIVEQSAINTGKIVTLYQGKVNCNAQVMEQHNLNQSYQTFSIGFYEDTANGTQN